MSWIGSISSALYLMSGLTALITLHRIATMSSESNTFLYFAYGSNLLSKRIWLNNPSAVFKSVGLLKGYRLEFPHPTKRWGGAAANVIRDSNSNVYGVLWELNNEDLKSLDNQEGVADGVYERFQASVERVQTGDDDGTLVHCWCYRITNTTRENGIAQLGPGNMKPSFAYKDVIVRGAKENNLPKDYITFLENISDNGVDSVDDPRLKFFKPS